MHRSLDYSWGLLFKNVSVQVAVERVMEVLKEFLETSTIHGLLYISTAKVSFPFGNHLFKKTNIVDFVFQVLRSIFGLHKKIAFCHFSDIFF